jgi:hypothetical protein
MTNINFKFFGSIPKSPTQMGSLSVKNSVMNISCLATFKGTQEDNFFGSDLNFVLFHG